MASEIFMHQEWSTIVDFLPLNVVQFGEPPQRSIPERFSTLFVGRDGPGLGVSGSAGPSTLEWLELFLPIQTHILGFTGRALLAAFRMLAAHPKMRNAPEQVERACSAATARTGPKLWYVQLLMYMKLSVQFRGDWSFGFQNVTASMYFLCYRANIAPTTAQLG